jgi:NAD(P)-dependent dehydrogenase (short-subunit alcohol dehydrogenase family)
MERLFEGKIALVTGAGSAIGRAVAYSYAANGAFVIVSDIVGNETVNKIKANGGRAVFIKSNVSKAEECKKLVEKIISIYGRIDIAFNNGEIVNNARNLIDTFLAGIRQLIAPKTNSVFHCMKHEIEAMRQRRGGVIINLSSLADSILFTSPDICFYDKQGVSGIQNEIRKNSDKAIHINCVGPGFLNTVLPHSLNLTSKQEISLKNKKEGTKKPEQIADLVMWLSSEKATASTIDCFPEYVDHLLN